MEINFDDVVHTTNKEATHVYIKPHLFLRTCIAHYTYLYDEILEQHTSSLQLVPDAAGCIVLSDYGEGLQCIYWGGTTTCVCVHSDSQKLRFRLFIEFLPAGAFSLLHQHQSQFLNLQLELDQVALHLDKAIKEAYQSSTTIKAFMQALDGLFLDSLQLGQPYVQQIQKKIHAGVSIQQIMNKIGYSQRHMQRIFQEQMGCTMKQYQRIERINQAVQYIQKYNISNAQLAQYCGYYDEAHFLHDFKNVMQISPKEYKERMSIFYNETFKF